LRQPLIFLRLSRERASCFGLLAAAAIPQHLEIALPSSSVLAAQVYNYEVTNSVLIARHFPKELPDPFSSSILKNRAAKCEQKVALTSLWRLQLTFRGYTQRFLVLRKIFFA